jgi:hypothetical protein
MPVLPVVLLWSLLASNPAPADLARLARLRLTWEEDDPDPALAAVDLPAGLAFGRADGLPAVDSLVVGGTPGVWVCRFPMPYRTQALLRIDTAAPLAGRVRVRTTRGVEPDVGYLRGAVWSGCGGMRVADSGRGHLAGALVVEGEPRPEGDRAQVVIDGRPLGPFPRALGVPGPDRIEAGATAGRLAAEANGGAPRAVAYRWLVAVPIPFRRGFAIEPAGDAAASATARTGATAALFWYSDRPGPGRSVR